MALHLPTQSVINSQVLPYIWCLPSSLRFLSAALSSADKDGISSWSPLQNFNLGAARARAKISFSLIYKIDGGSPRFRLALRGSQARRSVSYNFHTSLFLMVQCTVWMLHWKFHNGLNGPHRPVWPVWPVFPFPVPNPPYPHCIFKVPNVTMNSETESHRNDGCSYTPMTTVGARKRTAISLRALWLIWPFWETCSFMGKEVRAILRFFVAPPREFPSPSARSRTSSLRKHIHLSSLATPFPPSEVREITVSCFRL